MKRAIILLISMAGLTCAQDKKADDQKRLESVTWDLKSHKLIWVVQKGHERNGEFVATSTDKYEISPDDAVMAAANERRGFTKEEAASLHKLLDTLSMYCAESVVWWDQGQGVPVDGAPGKSHKVEEKDPFKPHQGPKKTPRPKIPNGSGPLIAVLK